MTKTYRGPVDVMQTDGRRWLVAGEFASVARRHPVFAICTEGIS